MAKFCIHCGQQLDEGAKFCVNCGNRIAAVAPEPASPQQTAQEPTTPEPAVYGPAAPKPAVHEPALHEPAPRPTKRSQKWGTRTISIALSALLVVQTAVVALFGWPGFLVGKRAGKTGASHEPLTGSMDRMALTELTSGTFSEENTALEKDGVRFAISEVTFTGETTATISNVEHAPELMGMEMQAYDFSVDTAEAPAGIMELTMPCDAAEDETVIAGYLNEETGEWEPTVFTHDRENRQIIIMTDHLSTRGYTKMKTKDFQTHVKDQMKNLSKGQSLSDFALDYKQSKSIPRTGYTATAGGGDLRNTCILAGITVYEAAGQTDDYLNDVGGPVLEGLNSIFSKQYTTGSAYTDSFIKNFGNAFAKLGLAMDVINAYQAHQSGDVEAYKLSMISIYGAGIGAIGAAIGAPALVGAATAISLYTVYEGLNKSYSDEWRARRMQDLNQRYIAFYKKEKIYRSSADWYRQLYPLFTSSMDSDEFILKLESKVRDYVQQPFDISDAWKQENPSYYKLPADKQTYHDLASLNAAGRKQMTDDLYNQIMTEVIEPTVLPRIIQQAEHDALNALAQSRSEVQQTLSAVNTLKIYHPGKIYTGMTIRFIIPNRNSMANPQMWEAVFNGDGEAEFQFTLEEHLAIGSPVKLEILNQKDEPVNVFSIKLDPPHTVHEMKGNAVGSILRPDGLMGNKSGDYAAALRLGISDLWGSGS